MRADKGVDCLHQAAFLSIFRHGHGTYVQYEQISPFCLPVHEPVRIAYDRPRGRPIAKKKVCLTTL